MTNTAQYFIGQLQMEAHPEGGYFKSTFRADEQLSRTQGERPLFTSIYFLLESNDISHLHRLQSDELWYYHGGSALMVHIIHPNGDYEAKKLGLNIEAGEVPQVLVPKHAIFGSSVDEPDTFGLVGCLVSPGFDFADFELFTKADLLELYPQHEHMIRKMAYESLD